MTGDLLLLRRRSRGIGGRSVGLRRSRLGGLYVAEHRACVVAGTAGEYRQGNGREHEDDCSPSGGLAEYGSCTARAEGGLAAGSAESSGDVGALSALQQDDNDDEQTNDDVDDSDENGNHFQPIGRSNAPSPNSA